MIFKNRRQLKGSTFALVLVSMYSSIAAGKDDDLKRLFSEKLELVYTQRVEKILKRFAKINELLVQVDVTLKEEAGNPESLNEYKELPYSLSQSGSTHIHLSADHTLKDYAESVDIRITMTSRFGEEFQVNIVKLLTDRFGFTEGQGTIRFSDAWLPSDSNNPKSTENEKQENSLNKQELVRYEAKLLAQSQLIETLRNEGSTLPEAESTTPNKPGVDASQALTEKNPPSLWRPSIPYLTLGILLILALGTLGKRLSQGVEKGASQLGSAMASMATNLKPQDVSVTKNLKNMTDDTQQSENSRLDLSLAEMGAEVARRSDEIKDLLGEDSRQRQRLLNFTEELCQSPEGTRKACAALEVAGTDIAASVFDSLSVKAQDAVRRSMMEPPRSAVEKLEAAEKLYSVLFTGRIQNLNPESESENEINRLISRLSFEEQAVLLGTLSAESLISAKRYVKDEAWRQAIESVHEEKPEAFASLLSALHKPTIDDDAPDNFLSELQEFARERGLAKDLADLKMPTSVLNSLGPLVASKAVHIMTSELEPAAAFELRSRVITLETFANLRRDYQQEVLASLSVEHKAAIGFVGTAFESLVNQTTNEFTASVLDEHRSRLKALTPRVRGKEINVAAETLVELLKEMVAENGLAPLLEAEPETQDAAALESGNLGLTEGQSIDGQKEFKKSEEGAA